MSKRRTMTVHKNGSIARFQNRRITMMEQKDDAFVFRFEFATDDADQPACNHETIRGKIRVTEIKLSDEALDAMIKAYLSYKKSK